MMIVASVSYIHGIGSVATYSAMTGQRQLLANPAALQYWRTSGFARGSFRVCGDTVDARTCLCVAT